MWEKKLALITGATSGIGKAFAQRLARDGYDLIITGRRKDLLEQLSADLAKAYGIKVEAVIAELANDDEVSALLEKIKGLDNLAFLINNAGFGTTGFFQQEPLQSQVDMIKVHCLAPVRLTHTAIQQMLKRKSGVIINVSSLRAFVPGKTAAIYSATKAFLNLFSQSLAMELKDTGVKVQVLCPGFTITEFHQRIGINTAGKNKGFIRWMSPEQVVECSLNALAKDQVVCIPGLWNKVLVALPKIIPFALYQKFAPGMGGTKAR